MEKEVPLVVSEKGQHFHFFVFGDDLNPEADIYKLRTKLTIEDEAMYTVSTNDRIRDVFRYMYKDTKELFYFTYHEKEPRFDFRMLQWPHYVRISEDKETFEIYPFHKFHLGVDDEEEIFRTHVINLYSDYSGSRGYYFEELSQKDAITQFLNFQFKSYRNGAADFLNRVERILFTGREAIYKPDSSIEEIKLYGIVKDWVEQKRIEIDTLLGGKKLNKYKKAVTPEPEAEQEETPEVVDPHLRLQMLIIHYMTKLGFISTTFHDKTKVAAIFSLLLGRSDQNIRTHLSFSNPKFIEDDLVTLLPLFKSLGEVAKGVVENMELNLSNYRNDPKYKSNRMKTLLTE